MFQVEIFQAQRDGSRKQDCTNTLSSLLLLSPILCQTPKKNHLLQEILLPSFLFFRVFPLQSPPLLASFYSSSISEQNHLFLNGFCQEGQQQPGGLGHFAVIRQSSLRTPPTPIQAVLAKLFLTFMKALQAGTNRFGGTEQYSDNSCSLFFNL